MDVKLSIKRFDPDVNGSDAYFQDFELDMPDSSTVLDALIKIREEVDGTLTLRCSCRSAICGSCAMRINFQAGLACNKLIDKVIPKDGSAITIEPMGNLQVIKDLVVDFEPFWSKVRSVEP